MRLPLAFLCLSTLAACATERERCVARASEDLRIVDRLIVETEQTIDRGYAIEVDTIRVRRTGFCTERLSNGGLVRLPCTDTDTYTTRRAVAVDLEAERRKLESLREKRPELVQRAQLGAAQCAAQFPEES
ncbi:hypothetical protein AADZ90_006505 [Aestuariibius sp. 2305UL40-4]|uniref:hypothetical protein n=1 Tax=Aestuariibius violaceus TaxID=3234132 RepID=UPI00345E1B92